MQRIEDFSINNEFDSLGFRVDGCYRVAELLNEANRKQIPKVPGVYAVLRLDAAIPEFIIWPFGDQYRKKGELLPLMYDLSSLEKEWIRDTSILYIGKADNNLNERLGTYLDYYCKLKDCQLTHSHINSVTHRGGRSVWQVKGAENFLIVWMETPGQIPRDVEKGLIQKFKALYGNRRPFANKQD